MDILLAFVFGATVGVIAHTVLPGRDRRGMLLLPAVGTLVAGAVWLLSTWLGATTEDPWIWVLAVAAPIAVVLPLGTILARARAAHDEREKARLKLV